MKDEIKVRILGWGIVVSGIVLFYYGLAFLFVPEHDFAPIALSLSIPMVIIGGLIAFSGDKESTVLIGSDKKEKKLT